VYEVQLNLHRRFKHSVFFCSCLPKFETKLYVCLQLHGNKEKHNLYVELQLIPDSHNMNTNQLQLVDVTNHTCMTALVPELHFLTLYVSWRVMS
jgi:hypothetical protein